MNMFRFSAYSDESIDATINVVYTDPVTSVQDTVVLVGVNASFVKLASKAFKAQLEWPRAEAATTAVYSCEWWPQVKMTAVQGVKAVSYKTALKIVHDVLHMNDPTKDIKTLTNYLDLRDVFEILIVFDAWGIDEDWSVGGPLMKHLYTLITEAMADDDARDRVLEILEDDCIGNAAQIVVSDHLQHFLQCIWLCQQEADWGKKIGRIITLLTVYGPQTVYENLRAILSPMEPESLLSFGTYIKDMCSHLFDGAGASQGGRVRWCLTFNIAKWLFHPSILVYLLARVIGTDDDMYADVVENAATLTAADCSFILAVAPSLRHKLCGQCFGGQALCFVHPSLPLASVKVCDRGGAVCTTPMNLKLGSGKNGKALVVTLPKNDDAWKRVNIFYILGGADGRELVVNHSSGSINVPVGSDVTTAHVIVVPRSYTYAWFKHAMQGLLGEADDSASARADVAQNAVLDNAFTWSSGGEPPWVAATKKRQSTQFQLSSPLTSIYSGCSYR